MADYNYFKRSGKFYSCERGEDLPVMGKNGTTRDDLIRFNNGSLPGIEGRAEDMFIVVTNDGTSYPRIIFPEEVP